MSRLSYYDTHVSADFRRSHGIHEFAVGEQSISVVSAENWGDFENHLATLPEQNSYVMTPELITSVGTPLDSIRGAQVLLEERTEFVQEVSRQHPKATIALGTAAVDNQSVRNGISVIRNGKVIERVDKHSLTFDELKVFEPGEIYAERYKPHPSVEFAICSEIVGLYLNSNLRQTFPNVPPINVLTNAKTLLVGSCWAIPQSTAFNAYAPPDEERYSGQLKTVVGGIFQSFPILEHIVMADRRPETGTIEPLNVHFARIAN